MGKKSETMKYIVYYKAPILTGVNFDVYVKDKDTFTTDQDKAKIFDVRTILEILIIVLQLILKHGVKLKIKRI